MLTFDGLIITSNGDWLGSSEKYHVYTSATHGTVTATPNEAYPGTVITLSNSPDAYYEFDYYTVDGIQIVGNTFVMPKHDVTVTAVFEAIPDPYNPLNLPPYTIRVRTRDGNPPNRSTDDYSGNTTSYETATRVPGTSNVFDIYKAGPDWSYILYSSNNIIEFLGANSRGVTNMSHAFSNDYGWPTDQLVTYMPIFDTSAVTDMNSTFYHLLVSSFPNYDTHNVTNMYGTFYMCTQLVHAPNIDTSKVTNMDRILSGCSQMKEVPNYDVSSVEHANWAFQDCNRVESGALAMYNKLKNKLTDELDHWGTFKNCGNLTTTGKAELNQIPSDWK